MNGFSLVFFRFGSRILSEADSGIVHDVSSPEDAEKIVINQDRSLLWSDTKDQSKPNTVKTIKTFYFFVTNLIKLIIFLDTLRW
jgi:hypothetical protein